MTWSVSASVCRSRNANAISQSARWQRISRAFHLPGAGRHSRCGDELGAVDADDSFETISDNRRDVSSMTSTGFLSPTNDAYGFAAMANDYTEPRHAKVVG